MSESIKHLFIIGNGFDLAHEYATSYGHFRKYLAERYPGSDEYYNMIPESTMMPDGELVYDEDEIAGYISRILDNCNGGDWNNLEEYLGTPAIVVLKNELDWLDFENDSDKNLRHAYYNNEDLSDHMKNTFPRIKDYFCDWIMDYYRKITYGINALNIGGGPNNSVDWKANFSNVLAEGDGFLTFNYTMTLENVYGIDSEKICHIHGKVGDGKEDIFMGHGEGDGVEETFEILGAVSNLAELKKLLYKNTEVAWNRHLDFFDRIGKDLLDIHSFGFSFSNVDLQGYISRIAEKTAPTRVAWYINSFDYFEQKKKTVSGSRLNAQMNKIKEMGFQIKVDSRW